MTKENRMDKITDKLGDRVDRVMGRLGVINKNTNPYRQEPVPDEQRIMEYNEWAGTPQEGQMRQEFGDSEIERIHLDMQQLMNRRQKNA